jgi:hypothetical protein
MCFKRFFRRNRLFSNTALIISVRNGDVICSLLGRNWTLIILSMNFGLQRQYCTVSVSVVDKVALGLAAV